MALDSIPSNEAIPRAPEYEAVAAIRGYVYQFLVAIEALLNAGEDAAVYIEAFEDVLTVVGETLDMSQVKDRAGTFSVTRADSLEMLERWAAVARSQPRARFVFVSRQSAGGLHDRSKAFLRWVSGERAESTARAIAASVRAFTEKQYPGKFPAFRQLLADDAQFLPFWNRIDWRFGAAPLPSRHQTLIAAVAESEQCDLTKAGELLFAWLGALALSASDEHVGQRRWTLARLRAVHSDRDSRLLSFATALQKIAIFDAAETIDHLKQAFAELHRLRSAIGIQLGEIQLSQEQIKADQGVIIRGMAKLQATVDAVVPSRLPFGDRGESPTRHQFVAERTASLEAEVRALMDGEGRRLVDRLQSECAALNLRAAVDAARDLEQWLAGKGTRASPEVRGQVYVLLADLAVVEHYLTSGPDRIDTTRAWELYRRAAESVGAEPSDETVARLATLAAKLEAIDGRHQAALERLRDCTLPTCVTQRLAILVETDRLDDAASLIESVALHDRWSDQAVTVWVLKGEPERAKTVISQVKPRPDQLPLWRCLTAFARSSVWCVARGYGCGFAMHPEGLSESDRVVLREGLAQLRPLLTAVEAVGRPRSGLDTEAVSIAAVIGYLLGDAATSRTCATLLSGVEPVPLEFARSVTRGHVDAPPDLPSRLRKDYPQSFDAKFLAAMIQGEHLGDPVGAFQHAVALSSAALSDQEKEDVCELVRELAELAGGDALDEAGDVISRILGEQHRAYSRWQVEKLMREDKLTSAKALLEQTQDDRDPLWLQYSAQLKLRTGDREAAARDLVAAARLLPRPPLLRWAAAVARMAGQWGGVVQALERLISRQPTDARALHELAHAYWQLHRYREGAECFRRLADLEPTDGTHRLNYAIGLALDGQTERSLEEIQAGAGVGVGTLEACLARAGLLARLQTADAGFQEVQRNRNRFWHEPEFLSTYMSLAYASGRDELGGVALARLAEMRRQGKLPDESYLKEASIEDLIELMKARASRAEAIAETLFKGQCPWILADAMQGLPAYAGWYQRTRTGWVVEDPPEVAATCLYATNSFAVQRGATSDDVTLVPFRCTPPRKPVVADMSALVTLHRLGLLEAAARFFGRLLIPAEYMPAMLQEVSRLQHHQPSQTQYLRTIASAVGNKRLTVCRTSGTDAADGPLLLQEYGDSSDEMTYGLREFGTWLEELGFVGQDEHQRLLRAARRQPSPNRPALAAAAANRRVCADLQTIKTLVHVGCFEGALLTGRLALEEEGWVVAQRELRADEERETLLRWHRSLFKILTTDSRFERCDTPVPKRTGKEEAQLAGPELLAASGLLLAKSRRVPLLADDRWCQMHAGGDWEGGPVPTFGVDVLLARLQRKSKLTRRGLATHYLQLLRWRYRFIVPPAWVLVELAAQFTSPPGSSLREVARYAHDCMRDPGLFGGLEPTTPPMSIALKVFLEWCRTLAEFVVAVWTDRRFDDAKAVALTRWAAKECLPSAPRALGLPIQANACEHAAGTCLVLAIMRTVTLRDWKRANRGLTALADALGVSNGAYLLLVEHMVRGLPESRADAEAVNAYRKFMVRNAFAHLEEVPVAVAALYFAAGFRERRPKSVSLPLETAVLRDPAHPSRRKAPVGPYVFVDQTVPEEVHQAVNPIHLLGVPDLAARRAALSELQRAVDLDAPWISQHARAAILQESERLLSARTDEWALAAARLAAVLEKDFALNVAGLHQALAMNVEGGPDQHWPGVARPSAVSLLFGRDDGYALLLTPGAATEAVNRCADDAPSLSDALDRYEQLLGHLPLAEPYTLGSVVRRWQERIGPTGSEWETLLSWADAVDRPLRWFHVCRAALTQRHLVPSGQYRRFWGILAQTLSALTSPGDSQWHLRADLAAHYVRYLQVIAPPVSPERLASTALWAAEHTARALLALQADGDPAPLADRAYRAAKALAEHSEKMWQFAPPRAGPSSAVFLLTRRISPWAIALAEPLGEACEWLCPGEADPEHVTAIAGVVKQYLVPGLGAVQPAESEVPWGFLASLSRAAECLAPCLEDGAQRLELEAATSLYCGVADPDELAKLLKSLPDVDEVRQLWICHLLIVLCSTTTSSTEGLWQLLSDVTWRGACLTRLTDQPLAAFFGAMVQLQLREAPRWSAWLPHIWANAALNRETSQDRRQLFLTFVIMSAAAGQNASALTRLREDTGPDSLDSEIRTVQSNLLNLAATAPRWTAARLRDIASQLAL